MMFQKKIYNQIIYLGFITCLCTPVYANDEEAIHSHLAMVLNIVQGTKNLVEKRKDLYRAIKKLCEDVLEDGKLIFNECDDIIDVVRAIHGRFPNLIHTDDYEALLALLKVPAPEYYEKITNAD